VRLDILERLADLIRPLLAWRSSPEKADMPPKGSTGDGGFRATDDMMSILGCSAEELGEVLKALGFRLERRPIAASPPEAATADQSAPPATPEAGAETQPPEESATAAVASTPAEEATPSADAVPTETPETAAPASVEGPTEPATVVDAAATTDETATSDAAAAAPEPQFEEIWRPRRHQRREGPRRDGDRDARQPRGRSRHARGGGAPASVPATEGSTPTPVAAEAKDSERQSNRRFDRRGGEGRSGEHAPRKDEGNRFRRDHEKRNNRSGDNRHEGRRRDEPRRSPQVMTAAPPKSSGGDSSPFAALAALKAQMEKHSEGSGST
jgi:ATP-dependent RNA helicase SUPV3L1/SUV3